MKNSVRMALLCCISMHSSCIAPACDGITEHRIAGDVAGQLLAYTGRFAQPGNEEKDYAFLRERFLGKGIASILGMFVGAKELPAGVSVSSKDFPDELRAVGQIVVVRGDCMVTLNLVFDYDAARLVRKVGMYYTMGRTVMGPE